MGSQALSVGLNKIIRSVKPQRILIEPTGLGHPEKLIATLTGEFYKNALNLKAVVNLVDARNLNNARYLNNETFIEQSRLADILIATKLDTYSEDDKNCFLDYTKKFKPKKIKVTMIEQGQLNLSWLDLSSIKNTPDESVPAKNNITNISHLHAHHKIDNIKNNQQMDWAALKSHADGYYGLGWKLDCLIIFEHRKLIEFIDNLFINPNIERVKAVINTDEGWLMFNQTRNERDVKDTGVHANSILEIISKDDFEANTLGLVFQSCQK